MHEYLRRVGRSSYRAEKLPVDLILDYALINPKGEICAAFEIKHRKTRYETVILSFNKVQMCRKFEDEGIPAFFLISMPDRYGESGLHCYRIGKQKPLKYKWGGRSSRDKKEPLAVIPLSDFDYFGLI